MIKINNLANIQVVIQGLSPMLKWLEISQG